MSEQTTVKTFEFRTSGLEKLKTQLQNIYAKINLVITIIYSAFALLRSFGLGETYDKIVSKITRLIMMINMLKTALLSLQASTPYGAAMAVIGGISSASMIYLELCDEMESYVRV